jgi:hypothetical protein
MQSVRSEVRCDENVRNRARLGRAFIGIRLRRGGGRFQMRHEHVQRLRETWDRDLRLEKIASEITAVAKLRQADTVQPFL